MSEQSTILLVERCGDVLRVTLNRPDVRNAFNADLITRLHDTFTDASLAAGARVIVLEGAGLVFCAGADLSWMRGAAELSEEENLRDATRMSEMFQAIQNHSLPVIAKVHGAALGGGAGLIAAADITVIADDAKVGFTEVRLGIIPSVISPFAYAKIGSTHARRYFLTGEIFDGHEAARIGLAQMVCPVGSLDDEVASMTEAIAKAGPNAVREAKRLCLEVLDSQTDSTFKETARRIASMRTTKEAQAGMAAFLLREKPPWVTDNGESE